MKTSRITAITILIIAALVLIIGSSVTLVAHPTVIYDENTHVVLAPADLVVTNVAAGGIWTECNGITYPSGRIGTEFGWTCDGNQMYPRSIWVSSPNALYPQ